MAESGGDGQRPRVPALRVSQWLNAWDRVNYGPEEHRVRRRRAFTSSRGGHTSYADCRASAVEMSRRDSLAQKI